MRAEWVPCTVRDEELKRNVAIKVVLTDRLADEDARRRFRREAETLSRLNHPHIAQGYDFGSEDDLDFLVVEEVSGHSLKVELAGVLSTKKLSSSSRRR